MKYIYSPLLSTWVLLDLASPPCDLYFDAAKSLCLSIAFYLLLLVLMIILWQNGSFYSVRNLRLV